MEDEDRLSAALGRLPHEERPAWIGEANRLARIVEHYAGLRPKRRRHATTGRYEFVPEVSALCRQAACRDPVILGREPHRARPPSPHTLDDLAIPPTAARVSPRRPAHLSEMSLVTTHGRAGPAARENLTRRTLLGQLPLT